MKKNTTPYQITSIILAIIVGAGCAYFDYYQANHFNLIKFIVEFILFACFVIIILNRKSI